jgi:hypothetical protein
VAAQLPCKHDLATINLFSSTFKESDYDGVLLVTPKCMSNWLHLLDRHILVLKAKIKRISSTPWLPGGKSFETAVRIAFIQWGRYL